MSSPQKPYLPPKIETFDSSEILKLIGPVQGYAYQMDLGMGMPNAQQSQHSGIGSR